MASLGNKRRLLLMSFLLIVTSLRFATKMMHDFKISNKAHHSVLQYSVYAVVYKKYYYCIMGFNRSRNSRRIPHKSYVRIDLKSFIFIPYGTKV